MKRKREESDSTTKRPSISRLKASVRQAKRFLAKAENEEAKQQCRDKLNHLETQLENCYRLIKNDKNLAKYKGVRFFERQKVLRKLKRAQQKDNPDELLRLRIDLNYVLHFPSERKYASLFPSNNYVPHSSDYPNNPPPIKCKDTDQVREWTRGWIKGQMERQELSQEPEKNLPNHVKAYKQDTDEMANELPENDDFFD